MNTDMELYSTDEDDERFEASTPGNVSLTSTIANTENIQSDHKMFLTPITNDVEFLSWNIMSRGKSTDGSTNNGHNLNEPIDENDPEEDLFCKRLVREAKSLAKTLKATSNRKIGICGLQELTCTDTEKQIFISTLREELAGTEWDLDDNGTSCFSKTNDNFGQLIFFNRGRVIPESVKHVSQDELPELPTQGHRIQVTDLTLRQKSLSAAERKIRLAHVHLEYSTPGSSTPYTPQEVKEEIDTLLGSTAEQVIVAGDFNQDTRALSEIYGKKCYFCEDSSVKYEANSSSTDKHKLQSVDGAIFKYQPETYHFTAQEKSKATPLQSRAITAAPFTKNISIGALVRHFKASDYKVTSSKDNRIIRLEKNDNTLEIKKTPEEKLQFTASNPSFIDALNDSMRLCLDRGAQIKIEATGGTSEARENALNKIWLNAVKAGQKVTNYKPNDDFLRDHSDDLPDDIRDLLMPAQNSPS